MDIKLYIAEQSMLSILLSGELPDWKTGALRRASKAYKRSTCDKLRTMIRAGVRGPTPEAIEAYLNGLQNEGSRRVYYYAARIWTGARGMRSFRSGKLN